MPTFYHGFLPVRQSHGHGASCFSRWHLTLREVGFGETMGQCRVGPCSINIAQCLNSPINKERKQLVAKLYGVAPLVADPSGCNSNTLHSRLVVFGKQLICPVLENICNLQTRGVILEYSMIQNIPNLCQIVYFMNVCVISYCLGLVTP